MSHLGLDSAEPPLSTQAPTNGDRVIASAQSALRSFRQSAHRRSWVLTKLYGPSLQYSIRLTLVPLLLVALTPATAIEAAYAAGPASVEQAELADFTFESITPDDETTAEFIEKPLILATDIGRPERELREREAAAAAARRAKALAAARRTAATRTTNTTTTSSVATVQPQLSSAGNSYSYGYCTWWAKTRRPDLPNQWGNANAWLGSAQRSGWATGSTPRAGAVVVTAESRLGHVGYVEAVDGDEIIVSDMNVIGWNKTSTRRMKLTASVIRGYIY